MTDSLPDFPPPFFFFYWVNLSTFDKRVCCAGFSLYRWETCTFWRDLGKSGEGVCVQENWEKRRKRKLQLGWSHLELYLSSAPHVLSDNYRATRPLTPWVSFCFFSRWGFSSIVFHVNSIFLHHLLDILKRCMFFGSLKEFVWLQLHGLNSASPIPCSSFLLHLFLINSQSYLKLLYAKEPNI